QHRDVAALSSQCGPAASIDDRDVMGATEPHGLDYVLDRARDDNSDRHLTIVGCVRRVERAAAGIEANLAFDGPRECLREVPGAATWARDEFTGDASVRGARNPAMRDVPLRVVDLDGMTHGAFLRISRSSDDGYAASRSASRCLNSRP